MYEVILVTIHDNGAIEEVRSLFGIALCRRSLRMRHTAPTQCSLSNFNKLF